MSFKTEIHVGLQDKAQRKKHCLSKRIQIHSFQHLSNLLINVDVDCELSEQPVVSLFLGFPPYCLGLTFTRRFSKYLKFPDVKAEHMVVKTEAVVSG